MRWSILKIYKFEVCACQSYKLLFILHGKNYSLLKNEIKNVRKTAHISEQSKQIYENSPTRKVKLKNVALFMFVFPPFCNLSLNGSVKRAKVRAAKGQNLLDQG